jgi:DNA-binding transcriptional regulator YiaG
MSQEIIQELISIRRRHHIPRREVSSRLGVHSKTVYRWEKNRCSPSPLYLKALHSYVVRFDAERARSGRS